MTAFAFATCLPGVEPGLKREVARDSSTIKRFVQEARIGSRIASDHLPIIADFEIRGKA